MYIPVFWWICKIELKVNSKNIAIAFAVYVFAWKVARFIFVSYVYETAVSLNDSLVTQGWKILPVSRQIEIKSLKI